MKTHFLSTPGSISRLFGLLAALALAAVAATAATLRTTDGATFDGEIRFTTSGSVFLVSADESVVRLKKGDLAADSSAAVDAWEAANATNAGLSTKFDSRPQPVRMKSPERPSELSDAQGIVMLAVIIDESGAVDNAFVRDSSDPRFNQSSVEAMKSWAFAPLTRDSQPTRGLMFVPLQF